MPGNPSRRYQTAGELARDLECFIEDRPIHARRASAAERLWRWARRNRALAGLAASVSVLLVLIAVVSGVSYVRTTRANIEEARQRKKAEDTSALALEALDNIFQQFAPDRAAPASPRLIVGDAGKEVSVPVQPVLSKEAAALLEHMLAFYDRLAAQEGGDALLRRKVAEANRRVGDIHQRLGNYQEVGGGLLAGDRTLLGGSRTMPRRMRTSPWKSPASATNWATSTGRRTSGMPGRNRMPPPWPTLEAASASAPQHAL